MPRPSSVSTSPLNSSGPISRRRWKSYARQSMVTPASRTVGRVVGVDDHGADQLRRVLAASVDEHLDERRSSNTVSSLRSSTKSQGAPLSIAYLMPCQTHPVHHCSPMSAMEGDPIGATSVVRLPSRDTSVDDQNLSGSRRSVTPVAQYTPGCAMDARRRALLRTPLAAIGLSPRAVTLRRYSRSA